MSGKHVACCNGHKYMGCCDPIDCNPCCTDCPSCPMLTALTVQDKEVYARLRASLEAHEAVRSVRVSSSAPLWASCSGVLS